MKWDLNRIVSELEISLINMALSESKTKTNAAMLLGINRTTLVMKMKKYGMPLLSSKKPNGIG